MEPNEANFSSHLFHELFPVSCPYSHATTQTVYPQGVWFLEIAFSEFSSYQEALGLPVVDQMSWLEVSKAQLSANVKNKVSQKYGRMDRC